MYLNAEVYTGKPMYDKAAVYAQKVIDAGFGLEDNYANLSSVVKPSDGICIRMKLSTRFLSIMSMQKLW